MKNVVDVVYAERYAKKMHCLYKSGSLSRKLRIHGRRWYKALTGGSGALPFKRMEA